MLNKKMNHYMMIVLCLITTVFGMDDHSESSDSSNREQNLDNSNNAVKINVFEQEYLCNNYVLEKYETKENYDINNLIEPTEKKFDEFNQLKRKRKSPKIPECECCQKTSIKYVKGKVSGKSLCPTCYQYESRNGCLISTDERKRNNKKHFILVCEFCQNENTVYKKGKISGKSLCITCYDYEYRYGYIVPLDQRKNNMKHKYQILGCEFCQKESVTYETGNFSGKSLCKACYSYERKYGYLVSLDERRKKVNNVKHKDHILVCEFCQKESSTGRYKTGKNSGKSLCESCYKYENKHGHLIPRDERKKGCNVKHKNHILECDFCQNESTNYQTGCFSGKSLCIPCYGYERRYGYLLPLSERQKKKKHKNYILVCEICKKESTMYKTGNASGKSLCISCYDYERRHGYFLSLDDDKKNLRG